MHPSFQTTSYPPIPLHIRWMIRRDMDEVLAIEQASYNEPWSGDVFLAALRQRNCIGMIVEITGSHKFSGKILGFVIYELHKENLHILNLVVDPKWRKCGAGSALVAKLVSRLDENRRTRIDVEVREHELGTQLFFKAHDFLATKVLPRWYSDNQEDAYLFSYMLTPAELRETANAGD